MLCSVELNLTNIFHKKSELKSDECVDQIPKWSCYLRVLLKLIR